MIDREAFYERRDKHCVPCEFWRGACLKGHALQSAQGCPLRKFPPIAGADYAPDKPVPVEPPQIVSCCGGTPAMPPLTWPEVVRQFGISMARWVAEGCPVVDAHGHGERYGKCKSCTRFVGFYCEVCKCVAYLKAKVATESCPEGKWTSASDRGA